VRPLRLPAKRLSFRWYLALVLVGLVGAGLVTPLFAELEDEWVLILLLGTIVPTFGLANRHPHGSTDRQGHGAG
jgi:hypothetical protein